MALVLNVTPPHNRDDLLNDHFYRSGQDFSIYVELCGAEDLGRKQVKMTKVSPTRAVLVEPVVWEVPDGHRQVVVTSCMAYLAPLSRRGQGMLISSSVTLMGGGAVRMLPPEPEVVRESILSRFDRDFEVCL